MKKSNTKVRKLYVWTGYSPDYTSGLAFAIAVDETSARRQVAKAYGEEPYEWGTLSIHPLNKPIAFAVSGGR